MAYYNDTFIVYLLIDISEPRFVGVARACDFEKDIIQHRQTKPPFALQIVQRDMKLGDAEELAKQYIAHYFTDRFGWNKNGIESPRKPQGQKPETAPIKKGQRLKFDPSQKERYRKVSEAAKKRAKFIDISGRLPSRKGEKWSEESKAKLKHSCVGRRREYREDGSWTWVYPEHHYKRD